MTTWNPEQYLKFANKRTRPALDLASQIKVESPKRIIDLGCGTGTSTSVLASKWPDSEITGLDSSAEMLDKARTENPELKWEQSDLQEWTPEGNYDVIFSNATLQWIDPIESLLTSCMESLNPGGAFAFQVPNNLNSPYHLCIIEVAKSPRWAEKTKNAINPLRYDSTGFYYDALTSLSSGVDA
ncbi:MAG: methyltransferase domain-containing protein [Opitutales bacterium]|nr:methyltransferase domain-containing protein [Opitutales bacterium]